MVWVYHSLVNHLPNEGQCSCFQFWAVTKKTAINNHVQVFGGDAFHFSGISAEVYNCRVIWKLYV